MSDRTKIEWASTVHADGSVTLGASWNPLRARVKLDAREIAEAKGYTSLLPVIQPGKVGWHCERVSPGCENCYAETLNGRNLPGCGTGLPYDRRARDLVEVSLDEKTLMQPLHWKRPRRIFVASMTDWCDEFVPDWMRDRIMAVAALCPQHEFLYLTKRADRMIEYFSGPALARVAALIYNVRHDDEAQRGRVSYDVEFWRDRDRSGRQNLAHHETTRKRRKAGRGVLQGDAIKSMSSGTGRIPEHLGIPSGDADAQSKKDYGNGTSVSVEIPQRSDSRTFDNQSQEWREDRQQAIELRTGNICTTEETCIGSTACKPNPSKRFFTSEDSLKRTGCTGYPTDATKRKNGQGDSDAVQNEPEGYLSDLLPKNLVAYLKWPLPNVRLGVSCEDQQRANERFPSLCELGEAGWNTMVSLEPLLGPVVIPDRYLALGSRAWGIIGGESGTKARRCDIGWIRAILAQCREVGLPAFCKQLGSHATFRFTGAGQRWSKGSDPLAWPADIRVQEYPQDARSGGKGAGEAAGQGTL